jgi:hypothetical protein
MSNEEPLRALTASMLIDCHFGTFGSISHSVDEITSRFTSFMDENNVEYELQDIQHAVIDSLTLGLKMKCGIKDCK